jgi:hypothetical protein
MNAWAKRQGGDVKLEDLTLGGLANGAAEELFQRELKKTIANIQDPNTDYRKGRTVSVKVDIIPTSENRNEAQIKVYATCSLAPGRPASSTAFFGVEDGEIVVREFDPQQMTIGEDTTGEETGPKGIVRSIHGGDE